MRDVVIEKEGNNVLQLRKMTRLLDETGEKRLVYITNIREEALEHITVTLPAGNWASYNMMTKELKPVCGVEEDGKIKLTLSFTEGESYVFVCGEAMQEIDMQSDSSKQQVMSDEIVSLEKQGVENCVVEKQVITNTENDLKNIDSSESQKDTFIKIPDIVALAKPVENCLTLDTAALSKDGVKYEEPLAIVGIRDNLLREKYEGDVYLKFTYQVEDIPTKLRFAIEPMYEQVWVNGTEVVPDKEKYWFDKSFATADISALTKQGMNEIVVRVYHKQRDYVYYVFQILSQCICI